jgi:threonyl-tRNA synthetase
MQNETLGSERKSLEQRDRMSDLERLRHSCAHVMATAIAQLWPDAQFAYGPPVETGFYYDVELDHRISPDDFEQIEAGMKQEIKANHTFQKIEVSREQALDDAQRGRLGAVTDRPDHPSKFKLDLIQQIPEGEPISYYQNGDFIDLCAGPHVMRTGNIGAFKLTSVASAYYKGDECNPQLQRIYGTAFKNKTLLEEWLKLQEEAKKRDHRKLGAEMSLYAMDPEFVGPGMPLWLPNGTAILEELEKLAKETEFAAGYLPVRTPHIAREKMYKTSGHLPYYAESMFPQMELREDAKSQVSGTDPVEEAAIRANVQESVDRMLRDAEFGALDPENQKELVASIRQLGPFPGTSSPDRYYLKAMNCPHHHRIFAAEPRSYRDLPLRLAEYGCCYRYEQSGELFGLMRVRSLNMNDAHIYCTTEQFAAEFNAVNEMYLKYFKIFGIDKYVMRFSTHAARRAGEEIRQ